MLIPEDLLTCQFKCSARCGYEVLRVIFVEVICSVISANEFLIAFSNTGSFRSSVYDFKNCVCMYVCIYIYIYI